MSIDDNEWRFRAIFDAAAVGILVGELSTMRVVQSNAALRRILGYEHEELVALGIEAVTHPDDLAVDLTHFQELVAGKSSSYMLEKRYIHRSGEIVWGRLVVSLASDAEGRSRWVIAMIEDISEAKRAQAALQHAEERLRQAQTLEAIGRLAGGIAHDFNNMLTVILSYSSALLVELRGSDRVRHELEEIERAAERAAELVHQLISYSRQEMQRPGVLDLGRVIADLEPTIQQLLGGRSELVLRRSGDARVLVDPSQLERVIVNLVLNARDAMVERGTLTIETAHVVLDETAAFDLGVLPGAYVTLAVTDTGVGMDEQAQARIFEPFFTTKQRGKGTGLGLATVYGIVKQSGGHIQVTSQLRVGTTLRVYLPHTEEEPRAAVASAMLSSSRGGQTILLVEDEEQVRTVVAKILSEQGFQVMATGSAHEALTRATAHRGDIHLLLTDLMLPWMDGNELASIMRTERPTIRVLFMSGLGGDPTLIQALLGRRTAFLQKPITPDALIRAVCEVLG